MGTGTGTRGDPAGNPSDAGPPYDQFPKRPAVAREEDVLAGSRRMLDEARCLLAEARSVIETGSAGSDTTPRLDAGPEAVRLARRCTTRRAARLITALPAAAGIIMLGTALAELRGQPPHQEAVPGGAAVEAITPTSLPAPNPSSSLRPALASAPTWLSLPRLGITARVTAAVGVQTSGPERGLLNAPSDYHDLGWFRQTGGGLLVIDGHVGYRQDPGPLAFIGSLSSGDLIILGTQSGSETFRVKVVGHSPKGDLPAEYFAPAYDGDLMLITCDYASPFAAGHFAANVYVVAVPPA